MCQRSYRRNSRIVVLCFAFVAVTSGYYFVFHILFNGSFYSHSSAKRLLDNLRKGRYDFGGLLSDSLHVQSGQACVHPGLELWPETMASYFGRVGPLQCDPEENWVYVDNGTFRISSGAKHKHGTIKCNYIPQTRGSDDWQVIEGATVEKKDGQSVNSDFFKVACSASDGSHYSNLHSSIAYDSKLKSRSKTVKMSENSLGLNVLMFGFDSVSKMTWRRNLPKSHKYFVEELKGMVLEGYNIVGDGTPQALLPILTGKSEPELPEARRGKPGATVVDGHPWIWNDFIKQGYVTQYGEDGASFGTFHYRMLGFKNNPVDHYFRPFYIQAEKMYGQNKAYCLGSLPRHRNMMNWVRDFFKMYNDEPKFSFLFHSEFSHGYTSELQKADDDLKYFLESLHNGGYLNKTVLILMADHGARFQSLRQTVQGKIEERMPYFSFRFPSWFGEVYPEALSNFKDNVHKLTTPYDIHATFMDILNYSSERKGDLKYREISLLKEIPKDRTCAHAGIEPHWCACVKWNEVNTNDKGVQGAVRELISTINKLIAPQNELCEKVVLENITSAVKYEPNSDLLKFKGSSDFDGRFADMSDQMKATETLYQVTIRTKPAGAIFEATVKYLIKDDSFFANDREISRINKYGDQPHCVREQLPHLRAYCYCKKQLK